MDKFKEIKPAKFVGQEEEQVDENAKLYYYKIGADTYKTANPALAARYDARARFFQNSEKDQETIMESKDWDRYGDLWGEAMTDDKEEQERIAEELNKMFR